MPATPGKKSGRQDPQTPKDASIELRDFMYEMESSAKKILIKSNKRRMDEALMAEKAALISSTKKKNKQLDSSLDTSMAMSSSMNNANAQTVVLQIPNGMKAHGMASTAKYGFTPSPMSTMKIDRPSLSVTVSDNEMIQESPIKKRQINFDGTNKLKSAANNLPNVSTPTSGKVLPPPPRLSMKFPPPNPIGTPTTPIGGKNAGRGGKAGPPQAQAPRKEAFTRTSTPPRCSAELWATVKSQGWQKQTLCGCRRALALRGPQRWKMMTSKRSTSAEALGR